VSEFIATRLEWRYSPKTFLEEPVFCEFKYGTVKIDDGVAVAMVDHEAFIGAKDLMLDEAAEVINSHLSAVCLETHQDYKLSGPGRTDIREDGSGTLFIEAKAATAVFSASPAKVDFVSTNEDGSVTDTTKERLDKKALHASLIRSDPAAKQMLNSFRASKSDPHNELVHLYEIRDALCEELGSAKKAKQYLGIVNKEWDKLGKLACNGEIKQGRHRGWKIGLLREATEEELAEARSLAQSFIKKYLVYLERRNPAK